MAELQRFAFDSSSISDQKRLVRGEHLLLARTILRARDGVHHRKWRVLMLSGGDPSGEIRAIRELMHRAHVIAVDKDPRCLDAAIEAGVDDVVNVDLGAFQTKWIVHDYRSVPWGPRPATVEEIDGGKARAIRGLPNEIEHLGKFDIADLDLCAGVNESSKDIARLYYKSVVNSGGVLMLTFSYGRDVVEMFADLRATWDASDEHSSQHRAMNYLASAGVTDQILNRLCFLLSPATIFDIASIMAYKGANMPMCSVLLKKSFKGRPSFVQVEPGDFEIAVVYPDAANLYDCPSVRIEQLRRRFAALKAAITRSERTSLLPYPTNDGE